MKTSGDSSGVLTIEVNWRPRISWRAESLLRRVARGVAAAEGFGTGQLSITVVGRRGMSTLHKRHLGERGPTDVLSFDLGSDQGAGLLDAEIILCSDVARAVAGRRDRSLAAARRELALYVTHGILHIAGYDDHAPADFERMHAREDELLTQLGLGAVFGDSRAAQDA